MPNYIDESVFNSFVVISKEYLNSKCYVVKYLLWKKIFINQLILYKLKKICINLKD